MSSLYFTDNFSFLLLFLQTNFTLPNYIFLEKKRNRYNVVACRDSELLTVFKKIKFKSTFLTFINDVIFSNLPV